MTAKTHRFFEVSLPSYIVQGETYARLVQPHFAHDIIEELHDGHTTKRVILHQLAEHSGLKEGSERQKNTAVIILRPACATNIQHSHCHPEVGLCN